MIEGFKKIISRKTAAIGFIAVTFVALPYHALIVTGIIPYKYVWGGRLTSLSQMYVSEAISVSMLLFIVAVVYVSVWPKISETLRKVLSAALFIIAGLMLLNTVGNFFAVQIQEKLIFTPLTFFSAIFAFRIALRD